jgi:3-hydroxyacyl-[acyl-carrier-protein] dehydratase
MRFHLVDQIVSREPERIVVRKQVSLAEEYLQDHFPSYPVLPGVLMLETMVQAAREMLRGRAPERLVLGGVRALKYGAMVRPGDTLEVEVTLGKARDDGSFDCRGTGLVRRGGAGPGADDETAVSGRFTMRRIRITPDGKEPKDHGDEP